MKIIKSGEPSFDRIVKRLENRFAEGPAGIGKTVSQIIADVKRRGDSALFAYTKKFDNLALTPATARVTDKEIRDAEKSVNPIVLKALKKAAGRIRSFHTRQKEKSWTMTQGGETLGQIIRPLESAGVYVPGGKASYPSSALMNIIPAKIAGVRRVVMVSPAPGGVMNPATITAAKIAGADEIWRIGGAQAVAALAFGTQSIIPVVKIVGPGNAYVAEAKRQVFGKVDIDMIAGPSEILVFADDSADPVFIAADLLSQAEHDEHAYPLLVTTSAKLATAVKVEIAKQAKELGRSEIIRKCLASNCYGLVAKSVSEGFDLCNRLAVEHLELLLKDAEKHIGKVKNAGALFIGPWTPEALGDYIAGPNHVLPTGGAARFHSALGVYDFIKRTSLLAYTRRALSALAPGAVAIANEEGLTAHANAVLVRMRSPKRL
jgi:histidinol dehydrogenase